MDEPIDTLSENPSDEDSPAEEPAPSKSGRGRMIGLLGLFAVAAAFVVLRSKMSKGQPESEFELPDAAYRPPDV